MAADKMPHRTLDTGCQKLLEILAGLNMAALSYDNVAAARMGMKLLTKVDNPHPVFASKNRIIETTVGSIPLRIYRPSDQANLPVVIFCHGGGWVLCDLDTHDDVARQIAHGANCVVVSVDYRLAPEYKFPAAMDDVYQTLSWVYNNAESLKVNKNAIALMGDSAGANLAAVTALKSRDMKGPSIALQCLIYPVIDLQHANTDSYREYGDQLNLRKSDMLFFKDAYLSDMKQATHPYVSPICHSDLSNLPETYIAAAGFDVLRDEAETYANKLQASGNKIEYQEFNSLIHGFLGMAERIPAAQQAMDEIIGKIKQKLHSSNS
jgi:acetyl esterase/lipase